MNKLACLIAVMALFAVASAQLVYSNGLLGAHYAPYTSHAYTSTVNHGVPAAVVAPYAAAPLTTAWTSHYAAAPLVTGWWKK